MHKAVLLEILDKRVAPRRGWQNPRAIKRSAAKYPIRFRCGEPPPPINLTTCRKIIM